MKKLVLLLSLVTAAPAFAATAPSSKSIPSKRGNGFVYESLTKVGDKAIIKWPRVKVGGEYAYINYKSAYQRDQGDAICKSYGYRSGKATWAVVTNSNFVAVDRDGAVEEFDFGGQYSAAYSVTCSNAPAEGDPVNY
ncbi:hypothetical protein D3C87_997630 [compost metagenome]